MGSVPLRMGVMKGEKKGPPEGHASHLAGFVQRYALAVSRTLSGSESHARTCGSAGLPLVARDTEDTARYMR